MIKVGVTGGIGSGKTTVCRLFEEMNIPVYYADIEAKQLMKHDKELKKSIKELLGKEAYHRNGRLNRSYVASIIFNDKEKLAQLNALVHPAVGIDSKKWFAQQKTKYAIKEAALLVENGSYKQLDVLIVVTAPVEMRIKRVVKRDKSDYNQVKRRIANQLPEVQKKKVADYIIDNSGDVSLISQVWKIHRKLME
ncbi:MAG: dephospho-CoA kinase [Saprospiraceae bacterium]|nr:dephospho-CoA kinase [Saprospiraceae bacterium]